MSYPNFTINAYFTENYGLGTKPSVTSLNKKPFVIGILLTLVCLILTFVVHFAFILAAALLCFLLVVLPILKVNKSKGIQKAWLDKYNHCRTTWDAKYDEFVTKTITELNLLDRSIDKLGLDPDEAKNALVKPFSIHGKKYDGYYRVGIDGQLRTDKYEITYLHFTENQVCIYVIKIQLTDSTKKSEDTQEFFYTDIVSVSTSTESTSLAQGKAIGGKKLETVETECFKLTVPGEKMSFAFTASDSVVQSVNGMKTLIRQKKMTK